MHTSGTTGEALDLIPTLKEIMPDLVHFKSTYSLIISSCGGLGGLGVSEENEVSQPGAPGCLTTCGGRELSAKNYSAVSLAIVTVLIEIQAASKCERFTNLHICLGCYLNYFPFPGHMPVGSRGGSPGAPQAGGGGRGEAGEFSLR